MSISAKQVAELRKLTGAGMMECKNALTETNGDMDAAVELLRVRLGDKALKVGGREATEGTVASYIHGNGKVEAVTICNSKTKEEETFDVDAVIPLLGFHSDLGAIKAWGLDTEKADIKVNQTMETNVPGIYAAGDITSYPGKLKLIATGASEACIAVNNAVHYINPKAKVNPGHSSNLAIFGQSE